ncbi:MAG: hypothetical protein HN688_00220 [Proteobacteria bacterium]|nr:hypothetical protein [Pseudomonadota bacterium]
MTDYRDLSRTAKKTLRQLPQWAGSAVLLGFRKIRAGKCYSLALKKQPIAQIV